jgi:hypothetical protein
MRGIEKLNPNELQSRPPQMAELQVATVRSQVVLSLFTDFEDFTVFKPAEMQEKNVNGMLDQVIAWSGALRSLRDKGGSH